MEQNKCSVSDFSFRFVYLLFQHYLQEHASDSYFVIKCTSLNCESWFSNVGSCKKHFIRKQRFDIFNEDSVITLYENAIYLCIEDVLSY